eukprot:GHVU01171110.1.p1 GENE.GHVU01171110.1~~GHVU01171110.1.p1  ORF type:complete len:575 (-),score=58.22 GHVU01171110.1:411-2135(-)
MAGDMERMLASVFEFVDGRTFERVERVCKSWCSAACFRRRSMTHPTVSVKFSPVADAAQLPDVTFSFRGLTYKHVPKWVEQLERVVIEGYQEASDVDGGARLACLPACVFRTKQVDLVKCGDITPSFLAHFGCVRRVVVQLAHEEPGSLERLLQSFPTSQLPVGSFNLCTAEGELSRYVDKVIKYEPKFGVFEARGHISLICCLKLGNESLGSVVEMFRSCVARFAHTASHFGLLMRRKVRMWPTDDLTVVGEAGAEATREWVPCPQLETLDYEGPAEGVSSLPTFLLECLRKLKLYNVTKEIPVGSIMMPRLQRVDFDGPYAPFAFAAMAPRCAATVQKLKIRDEYTEALQFPTHFNGQFSKLEKIYWRGFGTSFAFASIAATCTQSLVKLRLADESGYPNELLTGPTADAVFESLKNVGLGGAGCSRFFFQCLLPKAPETLQVLELYEKDGYPGEDVVTDAQLSKLNHIVRLNLGGESSVPGVARLLPPLLNASRLTLEAVGATGSAGGDEAERVVNLPFPALREVSLLYSRSAALEARLRSLAPLTAVRGTTRGEGGRGGSSDGGEGEDSD